MKQFLAGVSINGTFYTLLSSGIKGPESWSRTATAYPLPQVFWHDPKLIVLGQFSGFFSDSYEDNFVITYLTLLNCILHWINDKMEWVLTMLSSEISNRSPHTNSAFIFQSAGKKKKEGINSFSSGRLWQMWIAANLASPDAPQKLCDSWSPRRGQMTREVTGWANPWPSKPPF